MTQPTLPVTTVRIFSPKGERIKYDHAFNIGQIRRARAAMAPRLGWDAWK